MSDKVSRKALIDSEKLLEWLLDLYHGTGDRAEKYAYGRVEQKIESGAFLSTESEGEASTSLITTIESQKEEIEILKSDKANFHRLYLKHMEESVKQKLEIESLKAITELAVKGLKEIRNGGYWNPETYQDFADDILEQIERLQNE